MVGIIAADAVVERTMDPNAFREALYLLIAFGVLVGLGLGILITLFFFIVL